MTDKELRQAAIDYIVRAFKGDDINIHILGSAVAIVLDVNLKVNN